MSEERKEITVTKVILSIKTLTLRKALARQIRQKRMAEATDKAIGWIGWDALEKDSVPAILYQTPATGSLYFVFERQIPCRNLGNLPQIFID